ncbi:uncharacterized protein VTP21DRAFT_3510 [Calcarisporiella thermophila]|uniref:uncharacterized protein n=1 Tax=Calcarisporiella thermophila TaxID=911321 RepID=UPI00374407A4
MHVWERIKTQVESQLDDKQRILLQNFLTVVNRVPASAQESTLAERAGDEAAFKNAWNFNLSDAAFGWLVLDISNGRVSAEWKAQGFNFSYRRSGAQLAAPTSMAHQQGSSHSSTTTPVGTQSQQNPVINSDATSSEVEKEAQTHSQQPSSISNSTSKTANTNDEKKDKDDREGTKDSDVKEGECMTESNGTTITDTSPADTQHKLNLLPHTLFISGFKHLPVTEEQIRGFFGALAPEIQRIRLMHDRNTQQQRNFCYVDFASESAFENALHMDALEAMRQLAGVGGKEEEEEVAI